MFVTSWLTKVYLPSDLQRMLQIGESMLIVAILKCQQKKRHADDLKVRKNCDVL